jgi:hypothetical protein
MTLSKKSKIEELFFIIALIEYKIRPVIKKYCNHLKETLKRVQVTYSYKQL